MSGMFVLGGGGPVRRRGWITKKLDGVSQFGGSINLSGMGCVPGDSRLSAPESCW